MAGTTAKELPRIEDFIQLANEGKEVKVIVNLGKQTVLQRVHPNETTGCEDTVQMYLLSADYTFRAGDLEKVVSKPYIYASSEETLSDSRINKNIANDRLKQDYRRLKSANIEFEEKYF